jgi:hypothetical protein
MDDDVVVFIVIISSSSSFLLFQYMNGYSHTYVRNFVNYIV